MGLTVTVVVHYTVSLFLQDVNKMQHISAGKDRLGMMFRTLTSNAKNLTSNYS